MITSLGNAKVASAVRLKQRAFRERERRFLVEGARGVAEALDAGAIERLFHVGEAGEVAARAASNGVETLRVGDRVMQRLSATVTPQGMVGVAPFVDVGVDRIDSSSGSVVVLHEVRDPGNAGTVLRSADGAGAAGVVVTSASVDVYNPKVVRAAAGSLFHLPVVRDVPTEDAIEHLRHRGFLILAADADGETDLYEMDVDKPAAFVFGNETSGLPPGVLARADTTVRIPLRGAAESLNLASAATVVLFEWARGQREGRRAALETIIASAAHDIRSPLTAMKGFGYALATRWAGMTEEQRTLMLEGILYDTDRLDAMVRQLVDAARVTSGRLELSPERLDVGDMVETVAQSLQRDPGLPPIEWRGGAVSVLTDPDRLRLAITSFIEATAWWASEGPIGVTARVSDGRLVVEVERAGTELTEAEAEELFRPRPPGTGAGSKVGLFVARGVARVQGGDALAEVGEALRFRLVLPVAGSPG